MTQSNNGWKIKVNYISFREKYLKFSTENVFPFFLLLFSLPSVTEAAVLIRKSGLEFNLWRKCRPTSAQPEPALELGQPLFTERGLRQRPPAATSTRPSWGKTFWTLASIKTWDRTHLLYIIFQVVRILSVNVPFVWSVIESVPKRKYEQLDLVWPEKPSETEASLASSRIK